MLATLKYLRKGGRISNIVAFAGTMLKTKPAVAIFLAIGYIIYALDNMKSIKEKLATLQ